jgi:tetratricopeptide (TPR) repeat protein
MFAARNFRRLIAALIAALGTLAAAATAVPAQAASTVLGAGPARACFEAAASGLTGPSALADCDTAISGQGLSAKDRTATIVNRGVLRLLRKEPMQALADFEFALRMDPTLGAAHVNRGAALVMLGRFDEAIAALDRGLALGTQDPHEAHFNRALAYERKGDAAAAYRDFRQALALQPDWAPAATELARYRVQPR